MLALPSFKKQPATNGSAERSALSRLPVPAYDVAKLEGLIARAEQAAEQLRGLDAASDRAAQLTAMEERLQLLERTLAGVERLENQLQTVQDRGARRPRLRSAPKVRSLGPWPRWISRPRIMWSTSWPR